ncbi:MAG TPA: Rrf2 family transcriptional regulator, partial [Lachnospiraceae bacterium]|nr:Rrf2 family transcriptional regulator [Lachnospiraceae bacterium]
LAKRAEEITFLDVVEAIEGKEPFFQCAEIRQNNILLDQDHVPEEYKKCPCLIHVVMLE